MNIFGIGEVELLIVLLIALVIAGPKRMIQWAYVAGRWVAKARKMWSEVSVLIQQELKDAGVDVEIPKELPTRASVMRTVETAMKPLAEPVKEALNEVRSVENEFKSTGKQAQKQIDGIRSDLKQGTSITNGSGSKPDTATTATPPPGSPDTPAGDSGTGQQDKGGTVGRFGTWSGTGNGSNGTEKQE